MNYQINDKTYEYDRIENNVLQKIVGYETKVVTKEDGTQETIQVPVYEDVLVLHYYKFTLNDDGYIIAFMSVLEGEPYDWYGQASAYNDPSLGRGCYKFINGEIVFDQAEYNRILAREAEAKREAEKEAQRMPAQVAYTAMMTDTELPEDEGGNE